MWRVTNVHAVCAFAALGGFLFGFDISSMAGVIGTNAYRRFFGDPVSYIQGYIVATMPAGAIFGTALASITGDRFSRKVAIQASCVFWIIGCVVQALSNGVPMLIVGRAVAGLGVGMCLTIVPIYQAEISPKEIRGRVVTLQQWAITWGILVSYFIQYGASFVDGGPDNPDQSALAFRIPWAIQAFPAIILFFGLPFLPFSPRWLASKDRWEETIQTLADLHARGNIKHPKVLAQYREIEESLRFEQETRAAGWAALVEPRMMRRVGLGMAVQLWSALSGMNVMMYYIVYVMQAAGIGTPLLTACVQYVINVVMTLPAVIYLDKWGRRPLMLVGALGMAALLYAAGAVQAFYGQPHNDSSSEITWVITDNANATRSVVACSYLVVAVFAVTWGPVSWTYPAEIFPNKVRVKAVSMATAVNWVTNTILSFGVPPLLHTINWKTYMIFGTFNVLAFIHIFLAAPETKNLALEEMEALFSGRGGRPWRRTALSDSAVKGKSNLDHLEKQIADGHVKVETPGRNEIEDRQPIFVKTVIDVTNTRRESLVTTHSSDMEIEYGRAIPMTAPSEWYPGR